MALVVVGPKDLPRLMHIAGRWVGKARAMADQFRKSFDDMARQSELDELRNEIAALRDANPLRDIGESVMRPLNAPVDAPQVPHDADVPGANPALPTQEPTSSTGNVP